MHLKVDHYTGGKVFIHGPNHCKVAKPETRLLIVLSKVCQMISKGELSRKLPKSRNMYVGKHRKKSLVIVYAIKTYPTENVCEISLVGTQNNNPLSTGHFLLLHNPFH